VGKTLEYFFLDDADSPWVMAFDGIMFMEYPLEKRLQLYLSLPDIEQKIFSWPFTKYARFILNKKDDDDYMLNYCSKLEELLEKYNINIL